ncbi:hypothetical protein [Micromonospora aurantiaca (nom. illeg.)]
MGERTDNLNPGEPFASAQDHACPEVACTRLAKAAVIRSDAPR